MIAGQKDLPGLPFIPVYNKDPEKYAIEMKLFLTVEMAKIWAELKSLSDRLDVLEP